MEVAGIRYYVVQYHSGDGELMVLFIKMGKTGYSSNRRK